MPKYRVKSREFRYGGTMHEGDEFEERDIQEMRTQMALGNIEKISGDEPQKPRRGRPPGYLRAQMESTQFSYPAAEPQIQPEKSDAVLPMSTEDSGLTAPRRRYMRRDLKASE